MERMGWIMHIDINNEATLHFRLGDWDNSRINSMVLAFHSSIKCYNKFEMD